VCDAYDNCCAVTGLRIVNGGGKAEAQAAHIWPVAEGGPDVVQNGIALSGTAHWLFDRHLISLTDDYRLLISHNKVPQELQGLFAKQLARIHLHSDSALWPHPAYIAAGYRSMRRPGLAPMRSGSALDLGGAVRHDYPSTRHRDSRALAPQSRGCPPGTLNRGGRARAPRLPGRAARSLGVRIWIGNRYSQSNSVVYDRVRMPLLAPLRSIKVNK
jgi:hypothetical protein